MTLRLALDTSAYSAFERRPDEIRPLLETAGEVWLSTIVVGELLAGFIGGTRRRFNLRRLDAFMARPGIRIGVIDAETAQRYAEIVNHLKRAGRPIPTNDIWIAAHAMQHGLQILTFDRHFDHIPQVSKLSIDP